MPAPSTPPAARSCHASQFEMSRVGSDMVKGGSRPHRPVERRFVAFERVGQPRDFGRLVLVSLAVPPGKV